MAKPTKNATLICTILSIIAAIGILIGIINGSTIAIIIGLLPATIYEVYRTEGESTKASSVLLLLILIAELGLIFFNVNFNIAEYLGTTEKEIGGYLVPLGDIKIVGPSIMTILSVILFVRTNGVYTKWLSVIIFITSFSIIYSIDPVVFQDLFKYAVQEGVNRI
jgi:hypothetical protein